MSGKESNAEQLADMILDLQAFYASEPPPCMLTTSSDLLTGSGLFGGREIFDLIPGVPQPENTVVPSHIFTPPTLKSDSSMSVEAYDTRASISPNPDEIASFPGLKWLQDDKEGPKHGAGLQFSRKAKHAKRKSQMGRQVVPRNVFPCRYSGCVGKDLKQKHFQRKYHRVRHETTVHGNSEHIPHKCWVRGCTSAPFLRADNLRAHLKNTHGKKSHSGKYQYVATQDRYSDHYDPEWIGEISEDGSPRRI